ncbi:signal peptidase II [Haloferula helveola]|uniref:signal peptidase II n=1 Tax=Haloferula helveola TaxID=490095 RepID=UPI0030D56E43
MKSDDQQPAAGGKKVKLWPWLLGVTLPLYVLDQVTKFWVIRTFSDPPEGWNHTQDPPIEVIPGFLNWVRVHNQGVAFGMGNGTEWAPLVFPFISIAAFTLITLGLKKGFFVGKTGILAVSLLVCGIVGNLTDRLVQGSLLGYMKGAPLWERLKAGYVVDFIDVKLPLYDKIVPSSGGHWPSFNVADSCICIAAVLLFISGWRAESKKS